MFMWGIIIKSFIYLTVDIRCRGNGIRRHISREVNRTVPGELLELIAYSRGRREVVKLRASSEFLGYRPIRYSMQTARAFIERFLIEVVPPLVGRGREPHWHVDRAIGINISLRMPSTRIKRRMVNMQVVYPNGISYLSSSDILQPLPVPVSLLFVDEQHNRTYSGQFCGYEPADVEQKAVAVAVGELRRVELGSGA